MPRKQRTAALYWPTSSVGGINTELRALRDEADARGDTFHVLRSARSAVIKPWLYPERQLIRGGDTFITIDGEAPHGRGAAQASAQFIRQHYDRAYLAFLCPHPTKAYGNVPVFLELLRQLREAGLPITGRVTDGYWESYRQWGRATLDLCSAVTVSQPAFASFFKHPHVRASRFPFSPRPARPMVLYGRRLRPVRSTTPLTVWTSQWKAIKGIHLLLPELPRIQHAVELYSNGILYYQLRTTPAWQRAVGEDHFGATTPSGAFSGRGRAPFYGYVPLEDIPCVLSRAWFMVDLMGAGRPRNQAYTDGSFNNTTVEALWYGACPVLHRQASRVVPDRLALFVDQASEVPALLNSRLSQLYAVDKKRQRQAREWVGDSFSRSRVYDTAVLGRR